MHVRDYLNVVKYM